MTNRSEMLVEQIVVDGRARGDVGDITGLAQSIRTLGLLQPIGVNAGGRLLFGGRRLAAVKSLGWYSVPVHVVETQDDAVIELQAELDENVERSPFTPVEAASLRRRIKELTSPAREEANREHIEAHRTAGGRFGAVAGEGAEQPPAPVRTVDERIADATGHSVTTIKRVDRIAELTADADPDVQAAAADALTRVQHGAPVKPALDKVLEVQRTNRIVERYPDLAHVKGDAKHVLRMGAYLDGVANSGDPDALDTELRAFRSTWAAPDAPDAAATAEQREQAFQLNSTLAHAAAQWRTADGAALLHLIAPSLTDTTKRSWRAIAADLTELAQQITNALPESENPL